MSNSQIEDPIQRLHEDHDHVLEVMETIELAVADLRVGASPSALQALRDSLAILEREVRAHAKLEESILYPALGRHLPPLTIETLCEEHSDIWWAMDLLAEGLREAREIRVAELRWHATSLVDLMRRHVEKENNVLFMIVSQMLSDSEYEALGRAMHEFLHGRQAAT